MKAYLAQSTHFQPAGQAGSAAAIRWFQKKLETHRQKQVVKQQIAYLRALDHHFLQDMGIDISKLGKAYPSLEKYSSSLAANGTKSLISLPVNMSSR
jgi:hypothetical protein